MPAQFCVASFIKISQYQQPGKRRSIPQYVSHSTANQHKNWCRRKLLNLSWPSTGLWFKPWRLPLLLDHLVLFVDDLKTAVTHFESRGFTVTPGGTNGPTHNALIVFSNDTYIELIALQSSRTRLIMRSLRAVGVLALRRWLKHDLRTRLLNWMSGPQGLVDLCFRGAELHEIAPSSPLSGIGLTDPVQFKRIRPDGLVIKWTLRGANCEDRLPRRPPLNGNARCSVCKSGLLLTACFC